MLPRNYPINSPTYTTQNIIPTSSVYHSLVVNKKKERQQASKSRRPTTNSLFTIASTSFVSVNTTNNNFSFSSSSTSSTRQQQQQQISFEDSYSAKTGIKTAALLGGMLALVILYLIWKARGRLCRSARSSSAGLGNNPRLSTAKFDLDYWLKQVDLLEAKEAERNRGGQSLYLELPKNEARNNREATATWIVDAYRHWRLIQYRQQQHLLRPNENPSTTQPTSVPYRRRRHLFRRFARRFFNSSRHNPSFLMEQSQSLIAGVRPSIVSNHFIPPVLTPTLAPRRTSSWPRLKSNHPQTGIPMSALQTQLARKRLLRRASGTTFEM